MAAAPASPHNTNCAHCGKTLDVAGGDFLQAHVCPHCRHPQPVKGGENYFEAFGLSRAFGIDRAQLEKRFYEVSRALHPDRFTAAGPEARKASLDRMSLLNQAYSTLKDPASLREYVLGLEGVSSPKPQIPAELAEGWFEVQDALMDEPDAAAARLEGFQSEFDQVKEATAAAIAELEGRLDASGFSQTLLEQLASRMQQQSYLKSMERDIDRISGRIRERFSK